MKSSGDVVDKKKRGNPTAQKSRPIVVVGGMVIIVLLLSIMFCGGKQCKLNIFKRDTPIAFQALQGGVRFKTPSGTDMTLSVVSSDRVTIKCVKQDGQDTIVRLSPAPKK